jgi:tetratricopeptide (TPR) repeat protein
MIRQLAPVSLCLLFIVALTTTTTAGDGGREAPFSLGAGARSLGMGGGTTALSEDASVVYYNPAGLAWLQFQEISLMHVILPEATYYNYGAWVYPVQDVGGFGVAFMRIATDNIVRRVDFGGQGEFSYHQSQFMLGYGRPIGSRLAMGANLKVVNQMLENNSDFGLGLDLGVTLNLHSNVALGAVGRDLIPPKLHLSGSEEKLPRLFAGGLTVRKLQISPYVSVTASADLEKFEDRSLKLHAGGEVLLHGSYALRAGFDKDNFAFGVGATFSRLKVDYAYKFHDFLEDSHRFSFSVHIGRSLKEQEAGRIAHEQELKTQPVIDQMQRQFSLYKEKADSHLAAHQLDSALIYYQRALAFDEENREVKDHIARIEEDLEARRQADVKQRADERELKQAIDNYYAQAEVFYTKKYYPAALDLLALIFESDSTNQAARDLTGRIRLAMELEIKERTAFARAAESDSRILEAIDAYNRVLDLDSTNVESREAKLRLLASLDKTQMARVGIQFFNERRYREARRQFEKMLLIDPNDPVALDYLKRMESPQVTATTLEALQRDKNIWPVYLEGLKYMRNNEYQKAIDAWQKVLEKYPDNTNARDNIEQARLRLKSEQSE